MKEEEVKKAIMKYNLAKKFGTLDKEYPVIGNIRDFPKLRKLLDELKKD